MVTKQNVSQRQFLGGIAGAATGAVAFPTVISSSALGNDGNVAPSERITMGCIGVGWQGGSNMGQFLGCIKSRKETITPCETAHRSATPGHLGRIALWLGRKIRFNPDTEEIIGDPTAMAMLGRPYRSCWHL